MNKQDKELEDAWTTSHSGDRLLWLYSELYPKNKRELTLAKGHCANTIRHLMTDERSLRAVDAAIAYGEGKIDLNELMRAAFAAHAASYAVNASDAAAYAARSAHTAADIDYIHSAAAAAIHAAAVNSKKYAETKDKYQRLTADICRKYLHIKGE